ncbi:hypothetical protein [Microbulbifer taiwanensis]|uniref:Uncharacterized protein n=1 Tax=Microbulbifer taiwanensis TaxID=986746 RepID=A0ABW1YPJ1_9GAMM|nr:hypothetical protein [Microbulbifer taiwanensis]
MKSRILCAALAGLCICTAVAQDRYVCRLGSSERVIEVLYASPPGRVPCEVSYTKSEGVQILWRSEHEIGYCEARAKAFAEKQAAWGWHCTEPAIIDNEATAEESVD